MHYALCTLVLLFVLMYYSHRHYILVPVKSWLVEIFAFN